MHNNPAELEEWLARDPITLFENRLADDGVLSTDEQAALKGEIEAEMDDAVEFAKSSPFPDPEALPTPV